MWPLSAPFLRTLRDLAVQSVPGNSSNHWARRFHSSMPWQQCPASTLEVLDGYDYMDFGFLLSSFSKCRIAIQLNLHACRSDAKHATKVIFVVIDFLLCWRMVQQLEGLLRTAVLTGNRMQNPPWGALFQHHSSSKIRTTQFLRCSRPFSSSCGASSKPAASGPHRSLFSRVKWHSLGEKYSLPFR